MLISCLPFASAFAFLFLQILCYVDLFGLFVLAVFVGLVRVIALPLFVCNAWKSNLIATHHNRIEESAV